MASKPNSSPSTRELVDTATSLLRLLQQFLQPQRNAPTALNAQSINGSSTSPNPLDVLHTSATLLKAHATKLSLLVINEPYTPSAIRSVLSEVANTCVPAMMSALEICRPEEYSHFLLDEASYRVRRAFKELETMTKEILAQAERFSNRPKSNEAGKKSSNRGSLASTGVVWEACDSLIQLKHVGLVSLVVARAEQHRAMLEDALSELKEWKEEEQDEGFEDGEDHIEISDGEDSIEKMLSGAQKLPHDREDLKESLDRALKILKLTSTLFQAVIKRRLKTFQSTPDNVGKLDKLLKSLKLIPHTTDELASAFYDLNNDLALSITENICEKDRKVIDMVAVDWNGREDQFTTWGSKCKEMLNANAANSNP